MYVLVLKWHQNTIYGQGTSKAAGRIWSLGKGARWFKSNGDEMKAQRHGRQVKETVICSQLHLQKGMKTLVHMGLGGGDAYNFKGTEAVKLIFYQCWNQHCIWCNN